MDDTKDPTFNDIHQIELIAHSLLSSPLDNLSENFESLNQSQLILLTRLNLIEQKLKQVENDSVTDSVQSHLATIKILKSRLLISLSKLDKIDERLNNIEKLVD